MNKIILIDWHSKGWVHKEFNEAVIKQFNKIDRAAFIKSKKDLELSKEKKIIFLLLKPSDVFQCIKMILCGCNVSYLVHKYNINSYNKRLINKLFWQMLKILGVKSLYLDGNISRYVSSNKFKINIWQDIEINESLVKCDKYKRLIIVGNPSQDKSVSKALRYAKDKELELINITDEKTNLQNVKTLKFKAYKKVNGDILWGIYNKEFYNGIQSGLPFEAIRYGIPILCSGTENFKDFSKIHSEYLVDIGTL